MVSFWPWRDQTSAESFEKTLSAISTKISKASAYNDKIRQRARKLKVGWTIYGGFLYIVASLIFILVTGWQNWGAMEYTIVSGGPVVLYAGRYLLTSWYNYRIANAADTLETLYKERDDTIEKLKLATKYNSTQQLLDKYGGSASDGKNKGKDSKKKAEKKPDGIDPQPHDRIMIAPPPTANIQRRTPSGSVNPEHNPKDTQNQSLPPPIPTSPSTPVAGSLPPPSPQFSATESAEFAPNAYDAPPQYAPSSSSPQQPGWLDRVVNALLGEDDTRPDNRLALICSNCRLVNGLAPPGVRTLEELGRWRCSSCHAWNGIEVTLSEEIEEVNSPTSAEAKPAEKSTKPSDDKKKE